MIFSFFLVFCIEKNSEKVVVICVRYEMLKIH